MSEYSETRRPSADRLSSSAIFARLIKGPKRERRYSSVDIGAPSVVGRRWPYFYLLQIYVKSLVGCFV